MSIIPAPTLSPDQIPQGWPIFALQVALDGNSNSFNMALNSSAVNAFGPPGTTQVDQVIAEAIKTALEGIDWSSVGSGHTLDSVTLVQCDETETVIT